MNRFWWN